jgi:HlyD family secretion protein
VLVRNQDVGFVYPGQKVKVKLAAYPFQKYGMLEGAVAHLSADATETSAQAPEGAPESPRRPVSQGAQFAYRALVTLDKQSLEREGSAFKLAPGMQVVVEINQGTRTVMEYLLSPIQRVAGEAGRER